MMTSSAIEIQTSLDKLKIYRVVHDEYFEVEPDKFVGEYTEVQKKWIEALESGNYQQTKGMLRLSDSEFTSFCCLGVACETMGYTYVPKPQGYDSMTEAQQAQYRHGYKFSDMAHSNGVFEHFHLLELRSPVGDFGPREKEPDAISYIICSEDDQGYMSYEFTSLTELNDTARLPFKDIAYLMRHYPQVVFRNFSDA